MYLLQVLIYCQDIENIFYFFSNINRIIYYSTSLLFLFLYTNYYVLGGANALAAYCVCIEQPIEASLRSYIYIYINSRGASAVHSTVIYSIGVSTGCLVDARSIVFNRKHFG